MKRRKCATPNSWRWYGFDLDGTIADNTHHGSGLGHIGAPIKRMTNFMKRLHKRGCRIKIVTARLSDVGYDFRMQEEVRNHIWAWCDANLGFRPDITDSKDSSMEALYDDRAKQVVRNKGITYEEMNERLVACLEDAIARLPKVTIKDKEFVGDCIRLLDRCKT